MSDNIRVRFAPSPTGHLHIGGARTALFNWLFARGRKGAFILRIEDTDRERSTDEYIESIMQGMRWLGLDWDEGPFRQTDRFDVYDRYIVQLLDEGRAYHCWCTPEELETRREGAKAKGLPLKYDRRCMGLTSAPEGRGAPSVRFKAPTEGSIIIDDMIKGRVSFENSQLDDLIIRRSDGTPTYNMTVVVDDVDMRITHVIRGDDHLNNTPRQAHIYEALGFPVPVFGHLPMILGSDKARLSKRHGATSVMAYQAEGYLPEALVNYLVRLGWSHGDQEVFSRDELIEHFSFDNVGKSAAVFNPEKLLWLNAEYIKAYEPLKLAELVIPFLRGQGTITDATTFDMPWLAKAVVTLQERSQTLREMAAQMAMYILDEVASFDEKSWQKHMKPAVRPYLEDVSLTLSVLGEMEHKAIEAAFQGVMDKHGVGLGKIAQPVRVALTGGSASPGIFEVIEVLGKEKTMARIERALAMIPRPGEMEAE